VIATAAPAPSVDVATSGPLPAFASVTVATVASGPRTVDPTAIELPATHALDITAWLEL